MKLLFPKPSSELASIVKSYIIIESLEDFETFWILPNAGNFIVFNRGMETLLHKYDLVSKPVVLPKEFFISRKVNHIIKIDVNLNSLTDIDTFPMMGVELLPTGYNRLFAKDAYDLRENTVLLKECIDDETISFEKLYTFEQADKRIAYIEEGLLALKEKAQKQENRSRDVDQIVNYIVNAVQNINVGDLIEKFSCSRSTLERDFKKVVGYTPKEFIQIARFCILFKHLIIDGYDYMKMDHDFFDQSHMNKAFKKFIDISPSKLQGYILDNNIQVYQALKNYAKV